MAAAISFHQWIDTLPEPGTSLLEYYGTRHSSAHERASLSITGLDEFAAIYQSLYIMFAFLRLEGEAARQHLITPFQDNIISYPGLVLEGNAAKTAAFEKNCEVIRGLYEESKKLPSLGESDGCPFALEGFLMHDLGKIKRFLTTRHVLVEGEIPQASKHEIYLQRWLETEPVLKEHYESVSDWIDIFDGLGYNPTRLAESGYTGLLRSVFKHIKMWDEIKNYSTSYVVFNSFLFDKAVEIGLPLDEYDFLIHPVSRTVAWPNLLREYQQKIVQLIWAAPLIFVKPPLSYKMAAKEFCELWNRLEHWGIVSKLTTYMINNMLRDDFLFPYNVTGLIHHTSAQGGSHFANSGTIEELFTIFFPFFLETMFERESFAERSLVSLNKFQALQCVEVPLDIFSLLSSGAQPIWRQINFASPEIKAEYFSHLKKD